MRLRILLARLLKPLVAVVAAIYFVIDALVLAIVKPVLRRIAHLKFFQFFAAWIASLGPYPTLAAFLIPVILLEPIKPVAAYLIASGRVVAGVTALVVGEVLKIMIIERIFQIGRPKLMTIYAFARVYDFVMGWLTWVQALPPWQAVKRSYANLIVWARALRQRGRRPRQSC
jgi:hypothetical protein